MKPIGLLLLWGSLILIALGLLYALLLTKAKRRQNAGKHPPVTFKPADRTDVQKILHFVQLAFYEMISGHLDDYGLSEEEYRRRRNQRNELKLALKGCATGDVRDKSFVKSYIRDLLEQSFKLTPEEADRIIPFENKSGLTAQDRFDILLYLYKQQFGDGALSALIERYRLDEARPLPRGDYDFCYQIDAEDIGRIFYAEYRKLEYKEKLDIIVQRIYQMYKGLSVIDEIRDQRIDGVSGGVNGVPEDWDSWNSNLVQLNAADSFGIGDMRTEASVASTASAIRTWDNAWIFFKGKTIRLPFLSFGSAAELKRVCQNVYKYNLPGQLSEAKAYKVNEMKDGSRVVVVRPPFADSWAFFIRKFDLASTSLGQLIAGEGAELAAELLKFLMKGSRITAITGSQGAGKTTLLMALVEYIYSAYSLRIQEMIFELHLRRLYPERNILSFRETDYATGQQGLDLQKKTDGSVNILGEVASDEVAAWMIQTAQVASLFTLFTHHAKTLVDLIDSLRNSLLKTGMFRDEEVAKRQVVRAVNFDVHLRHEMNGRRYIERITECRPDAAEEQGYAAKDIVVFRNGRYEPGEPLSQEIFQEMKQEMHPEDAKQFAGFVKRYWGEKLGA